MLRTWTLSKSPLHTHSFLSHRPSSWKLEKPQTVLKATALLHALWDLWRAELQGLRSGLYATRIIPVSNLRTQRHNWWGCHGYNPGKKRWWSEIVGHSKKKPPSDSKTETVNNGQKRQRQRTTDRGRNKDIRKEREEIHRHRVDIRQWERNSELETEGRREKVKVYGGVSNTG